MKPATYHAAARKLRTIADQLDARSAPRTPRQKAALTSAVYGLSRYAKTLADRHRRTVEGKPKSKPYCINDDVTGFILREDQRTPRPRAAKITAKKINRKFNGPLATKSHKTHKRGK
jgi:hypothetical protein